ncbi:MAG: hypothetical protein ABJA94_07915 [Rhodoglobus sp.]
MAEIDDLLSGSLKRIAQPGDTTGVADAIRSRVDAGDTGAPANSSGFTSGAGSWLPWVGLIVVLGLVGGASGVFGLAGRPVEAHEIGQATGLLGAHSVGLDCVGGPVVATLPAGQRVLAIARSDDSRWLGVRNPITLTDTVWVPVVDITVDDGEPAIETLPVGGSCPVVTVVTDPPPVVVAPVTPVTPVTPVGPQQPPVPDTTAPSVGKPTSNVDPVCSLAGSGPYTATISVTASDDVGVAGVSISWSGVSSNSASMSGGGTNWSYLFTAANSSSGNLTFTVVATDGAGNQSSSKSVTIKQQACVG